MISGNVCPQMYSFQINQYVPVYLSNMVKYGFAVVILGRDAETTQDVVVGKGWNAGN